MGTQSAGPGKIYFKYTRDFISLSGLVVALIITLTLTSIAGSAQAAIVRALGLEGIDWLRPAMTLIALSISIFANYLLFLWIFWMLPRHKPKKRRCYAARCLRLSVSR